MDKQKENGLKTKSPEPIQTTKEEETVNDTRNKVLSDVKQILMWSNATPIWEHSHEGYECAYCEDVFSQPGKLKKHTLNEHDNVNEARFFILKLFEYVLKLDVTDLKCNCCGHLVDSLQELIEHLKLRHKKKIDDDVNETILSFKFECEVLRCVVCFNDFPNFAMLQDHMITHCNKKFVCEKCGASFMWKSGLHTHLKEHANGDNVTKCGSCFRKFTTKKLRDDHALECRESKVKCDYCPNTFTNAIKRQTHMVNKHGSRGFSFVCNICNKYFEDNYRLQNHIRATHMMEKNSVCQVCGKSFFGKGALARHFLTHSGRKDYKCELCGKGYRQKDGLNVHMRTHTNEKPFRCEECGQRFTQKVGLKGHLKSRHGRLL